MTTTLSACTSRPWNPGRRQDRQGIQNPRRTRPHPENHGEDSQSRTGDASDKRIICPSLLPRFPMRRRLPLPNCFPSRPPQSQRHRASFHEALKQVKSKATPPSAAPHKVAPKAGSKPVAKLASTSKRVSKPVPAKPEKPQAAQPRRKNQKTNIRAKILKMIRMPILRRPMTLARILRRRATETTLQPIQACERRGRVLCRVATGRRHGSADFAHGRRPQGFGRFAQRSQARFERR